MDKLKQYLKLVGKKPSPWGVEHGIAPAIMSRVLNGKQISPRNARKIAIATGGFVTPTELLYPEKLYYKGEENA